LLLIIPVPQWQDNLSLCHQGTKVYKELIDISYQLQELYTGNSV